MIGGLRSILSFVIKSLELNLDIWSFLPATTFIANFVAMTLHFCAELLHGLALDNNDGDGEEKVFL